MDRKGIAINGIIAGLYIVLTLINPLSFGVINIRIADFIPVIAIIDNKKRLGVTLGMAIANFFSLFGLIDVVVALMICLFSFYLMNGIKSKNIRILLLAISTSVLVSIEVSTLSHMPLIFELLIMLITQIPMCFIGAALWSKIERVS